MANKKYVSLSKLSSFLDKLKGTFASLTHTHKVSDLTDYTVDSELSSTSTNPVQNKTIDAEFEAIASAMGALETAIDGKADAEHTHNYAGSSSAGGAATSANKLETAVTINGVSFDGSANITTPANFGVVTSGDGSTYTATVDGITALTSGVSFTMIPHVVSASNAPKLNVNGLGAKVIRRRVSNATTSTSAGYNASWLAANKSIRVEYDGTYWIADLPKPSAADISGTVKVANGGTGKTSVTAGSFLVGNGTSAMTEKTPAETLTALGLTATATELNYCDGVTSNIQTQIDTLSSEKVDEERVNELIAMATGSDVTTQTVLSDNLFDKSIATTGKAFYHSSSGPSLVDKEDGFYAYVPLRGAGTYRTVIWWAYHGDTYALRVPILKADNSFLQNVTCTLTKIDDTYGYIEFTVTEAMVSNGAAVYAFDGMFSGANYNLDTLMIVKDREYPTTYIPYGYIEVEVGGAKAENILSGKTAVFLGDSICAGTTTLADATEYGWGWGGIIGEANKMAWKNYGRNGGTITPIESVDEARWVPSQVDLAIADYPNADYVIFEGGTNDADTLGASGLGTLSESGYAPSSEADFTGAFETLVLKILNAYPNAKVGYIVAPKMGEVNDFSAANNNRRKFFDHAVEICEKWGVPVIDLWKNNPMNPKLSVYYDSSLTADQANTNGKCYTDGQHLTLTGYQRITPQIEAFMRSL